MLKHRNYPADPHRTLSRIQKPPLTMDELSFGQRRFFTS